MCYLSQIEPEFADYENGYYKINLETKPWYNGRERGFVVSMSRKFGRNIHIAVFEHRNSDDICALKWETEKPYWNHPLEDPNIFEKAYSGKTKWDVAFTVKSGEIGKMADWVYKELKNFYARLKAENTD